MYVLLNGSFGIGKTTVARQLRARLPGAVIFDPEWIGFVLQRLPGGGVDDFQDLPRWRHLTVLGARLAGVFGSVVIIPMTFSEQTYLNEIQTGLARSRRSVRHFCLTAPLDVVRGRLAARGEPVDDPKWSWVHRRATECCAAHESEAFATLIPTDGRTPEAVAADIADAVRGAGVFGDAGGATG